MNEEKYMRAHAILDQRVGEQFNELQAAQNAAPYDVQKVSDLKAAFQSCFDAWTNLHSLSDEQLQAVIDSQETVTSNNINAE